LTYSDVWSWLLVAASTGIILRIAAGYDADFTIVDLKRRMVINNRWIASRCGWTPYEGVSVLGWPIGTIIRGMRVMWDGEVLTPGRGEPVRFLQAL